MQLLAVFIFFTRLPFWKIKEVPKEYFKNVVFYWPLVGILTGGIMALMLFFMAQVFPLKIAVIFALISRVLITGGLHEDGLADFFDGFGGGLTRETTLAIMKDSHIGTYGVLSLIIYYILSYSLLISLPLDLCMLTVFVGDIFAKAVASNIINLLPYARKEEESKAKNIYNKMKPINFIFIIIMGLSPLFLLFPPTYYFAIILPVLLFFFLINIMKHKISGYTGDCCGALFLLCEIAFYISILAIFAII